MYLCKLSLWESGLLAGWDLVGKPKSVGIFHVSAMSISHFDVS